MISLYRPVGLMPERDFFATFWIFNGGSGTNWYLKVPYGYQASKSLARPEKRGFAPQDIVLLTYHAKIPVLRSVR